MKHSIVLYFMLICGIGLCFGDHAFATQGHGDPEGLYVHQMSHLFFAFAMGILIYWLRIRGLVREQGWRYIQYSAIFFILWTFDAFTVHLLDEQYQLIQVINTGDWTIHIQASNNSNLLQIFYYAVKLDHLLCAPALFLLYLGLKQLLRETENINPHGDQS